jgi:Mor family transcriptional regulator
MQKTSASWGNYRIENCHGQNGLLISLLDLIKDTDLLSTQWWRGLGTINELMARVHQRQRINPANHHHHHHHRWWWWWWWWWK